MRQINFFLFLLLAQLASLQAQTLEIQGVVDDNGTPVTNHSVIAEVEIDGIFFTSDTVWTDTQGAFAFSFINLPPSFATGTITFRTDGCNGTQVLETQAFSPNNLFLLVLLNYCGPPSGCQADFLYTTTISGTFLFIDNSTPHNPLQPLTYLWDLGDGNTSTQENPSHTYAQAGTYTVCLTILDNTGCTDSMCQVIQIVPINSCQANFAYAIGQSSVSFTPLSASGNVSYSWDFGDGVGTSTLATPSYTYAQPGIYSVCLTIFDAATGCSDTWCEIIFVGMNNVCYADFSVQSAGNGVYHFFNQSFSGTPIGGNPLTYQWSFGDGSTSTNQTAVHTYTQSGVYNVCLIIDDGNGCTDTTCQTLVVPGANGCIADFTYSAGPGGLTHFLSTSSGQNLSYTWDFGDGTTGTNAYPAHAYSSAGVYLVCLTVTDSINGCTDTYCDNVVVTNVGTGGFCAASFNLQQLGPDTYQFFDQSNGANPGGSIQSWSWDFGDGSVSTLQNPVHTFPQTTLGVFNVCLTIVDTSGCSDAFCTTVFIPINVPCQGYFTYAYGPGLTVDFFASPANSQNVQYSWTFGDGSASTAVNPSHTYAAAGSYPVYLTLTDPIAGCTFTYGDTVTVPGSNVPCQANFSYQQSAGGSVVFFSQATGGGPGAALVYAWDFGDGNTAVAPIAANTYTQNGTYTVCMSIMDVGTGCTDTTCQTVIISNTVGCTAAFTYTYGPNNLIYFQSASQGPGYTYAWDFGDGTGQIGPVTNHSYSTAGTYQVCLTVDNGTCSTSYCESIVASVPGTGGGCQASFLAISNSNGGYQFINTSTPDPALVFPSTSVWDFGDGTQVTSLSPVHAYNGPGPFTVCLAYTTANCSDTICQTIGGYSVNGAIYAGNSAPTSFVNDGIAYLIYHDVAAGTLTAVDSVPVTQSFYSFQNVAPGTYLVKAALRSSSPVYTNYLPTYLGDELFWSNALSVVVTNTIVFNPDINLTVGVNPGGPGFIGGLISQGANKTEGDPMMNVSVLLLDEFDNPITHTTTNAQGEYGFSNLAYGTYHVYVERAGLISSPRVVVIDANNPAIGWADFEVNSTSVTTGIESRFVDQALRLYPNPASRAVTLEVDVLQTSEGTVSLLNLMGQTLYEASVQWYAGKQQVEMELAAFPEGTYFVVIRAGDQLLSKRLVKKD